MSAADRLRRHGVSILAVALALAAGGAAFLPSLPVSLFPEITFPRVVVNADAGDRPADRMAVEVTRPLEEAVRGVPGVVHVRSRTSRGSCEISLDFHWGLDMVPVALQVESAITQLLSDLPAGFRFDVRRMDPTVFPVIGLSLTSTSLSLVELRDLARFDLGPRLSTIDGVARLDVVGGRAEEFQVEVDPLRLEAAGVTMDEVAAAVSAGNVVQAVGRLEQDEKLYLLLSDTELHDAREIEATIVKDGPQGFLRVGDVAKVVHGTAPQWTRVVADGRDAVLLNIYQQPGHADTIGIARALDARLAEYRASSHPSLTIGRWYDQSDLVRAAVASVRDAIWVGIILAVGVLSIFLRDLRLTAVVILAVPVSLAIAVLFLELLGLSLNIMTLGGMAAAVGLVIDDAIVVVEHVARRAHENADFARAGDVFVWSRETWLPLTGSSLATVVIFAPLAFVSGVGGAFFQALSLTITSALVASYALAALAVPVVTARLLRGSTEPIEREGAGFVRLLRLYEKGLGRLLDRPLWILAVAAPVALAGFAAYRTLGSGFMPAMDEGGFVLDYRAPAGTSLTETDRQLRELEGILAEVPEVDAYSRRTGFQLGGGITEANEGDYFIRLRPTPRRPIASVMDEIRRRAEMRVPALEIELAQLMGDLIGDLTAVPQPIEVKLFGPDASALRAFAEKVSLAVGSVPDVVDVKDGLVVAGDAVELRLDRTRVGMLGLRPDQVTRLARLALDGEVVTWIQKDEKWVGVRIWTDAADRATRSRIEALRLRTPEGVSVRLGRMADVEVVVGQPQVTREDLKTMVAVTGRISGRDLGSVMQDVRSAVSALPWPPDVYVRYGGLYAEQQQSFRGLLGVLGAAVVLVFLLVLFLSEQLMVPVAVLGVASLAGVAVLLGLRLTGSELDLSSLMGLTMVVGISSEAAIFYVTQWNDSAQRLPPRDALLEAGRLRLRPILMTALAAIGAFLPLAVGLGEGSALLRPLAIAIVAGLLATVPGVLLLLPALLWLGQRAASSAESGHGAVPYELR